MKLKQIKNIRKAGFTLVEIMIVVAIIGLLAAIAIPNFMKARDTATANACINNMRQVDGAIQQWALEQGKATDSSVTEANLVPYIGRGGATTSATTLAGVGCVCPLEKSKATQAAYGVTTVGAKPTCPNVGTAATHVLPN